MLKLVQFTGVHFPDLNPNFYTYHDLNNMKLDLNVSTKVKFSANDQGFWFKNQSDYRFFNLNLKQVKLNLSQVSYSYMGNSSTMTLPLLYIQDFIKCYLL